MPTPQEGYLIDPEEVKTDDVASSSPLTDDDCPLHSVACLIDVNLIDVNNTVANCTAPDGRIIEVELELVATDDDEGAVTEFNLVVKSWDYVLTALYVAADDVNAAGENA